VKQVDASVYHYGWVKNPKTMQTKLLDFHRLWHDENWIRQNVKQEDFFDFSDVDSLALFTETHPAVMADRIRNTDWKIDLDISKKKLGFKNLLLHYFEKLTSHRLFEYKNYRIS
jgi:hypothetical protein